MGETFRSILCGEEFWCMESYGWNQITFKPDGTGEVSRSL